ncbi:MAG: YncE family protein [Desulfobacterales bacterium]
MMGSKLKRWTWLGCAAAILCTAAVSWGAVDWKVAQTLEIGAEPLDLAVSPDGQWIYVLTADAKVLVFSREGELKNRLEVGEGVVAIDTGPAEGALFLADRTTGRISVVDVTLQYAFDGSGSPSKGPADAPVVIAVFSDFQ